MRIETRVSDEQEVPGAASELSEISGGSHGPGKTSASDQCNRFAQLLQYDPGPGSHLLADNDYQNVGPIEEVDASGIDLRTDAYVTVGRFNGKARRKMNAVAGSFVAIDIDHGDPDALAQAILKSKVRPAAVVRTAKGIHVWWRLESPEPPAQRERLTAHLVKVFGADERAKDCTRLLRLPGSMHTQAGVLVRLLHADENAKATSMEILGLTLEDGATVRSLLSVPPSSGAVARPRVERKPIGSGRKSSRYLPAVPPGRELPATHQLQRLSRKFPEANGNRDDLMWRIYWEAYQCGWRDSKILAHLQSLVAQIPGTKKRSEWVGKLPSECRNLARKCQLEFGLVRSTFKTGMMPHKSSSSLDESVPAALPLADAEKALEQVLFKRLSTPSPKKNMVVQATPGLGKSRKALEIIKHLATKGMKFAFLTDTREQAMEQAGAIGLKHYQAPEDRPGSIYHCADYGNLEKIIERGGNVRGHCWKCSHRLSCPAFQLREDLPKQNLLVSTKASARHSPELLKDRHVVCDERLDEFLFEDYALTGIQLERFIDDGTAYIEENADNPAATGWNTVVWCAAVLRKSIARMGTPGRAREPGLFSSQLCSRIRRLVQSKKNVKLDVTRADLGLGRLFTTNSRPTLPWETSRREDQLPVLGALVLRVVREALLPDTAFPHRVVGGELHGRVVSHAAAQAFKDGRVTVLDALGLPQFLVDALGMDVQTVDGQVENLAVIAAVDKHYPDRPDQVIELMQTLHKAHGDDFFAMVSKKIELAQHGIPADCIGHYGADDRARNNLAGRHHILVLRHQQNLDAAWIGFEAWCRFAADQGCSEILKGPPTSHRSTRRVRYPGQWISVRLPQSPVATFQDYLEHTHDGFVLQAIHRARPVRSPDDLFLVYLLDWEPVRSLRYSRFVTTQWLSRSELPAGGTP